MYDTVKGISEKLTAKYNLHDWCPLNNIAIGIELPTLPQTFVGARRSIDCQRCTTIVRNVPLATLTLAIVLWKVVKSVCVRETLHLFFLVYHCLIASLHAMEDKEAVLFYHSLTKNSSSSGNLPKVLACC